MNNSLDRYFGFAHGAEPHELIHARATLDRSTGAFIYGSGDHNPHRPRKQGRPLPPVIGQADDVKRQLRERDAARFRREQAQFEATLDALEAER